jgi:hypothetical protein
MVDNNMVIFFVGYGGEDHPPEDSINHPSWRKGITTITIAISKQSKAKRG